MSEEPYGRLTRRAVTALSRLADTCESADREWAAGLLAELDEVPPGRARLRWALGGVWMLLSGSLSGRRRLLVLARRPASWAQRMLSLLLLPHAYLMLLAYSFTVGDYEIGDPRGPAFVALTVGFTLTAVLAWWRPVPAMAFGLFCAVAEVLVLVAPAGRTEPDGGYPSTAGRILSGLQESVLMILPAAALMLSIAAISLAPRPALRTGMTGRIRAVQLITGAALIALVVPGWGALVWVCDRLGVSSVGPVLALAVLTAAAVPVCVLLGPLAAVSGPGRAARTVPGRTDPARTAPAG